MTKKYIFLFAAILSFLVFIGFLSESGPYSILGVDINIWIIRIAWLLIAMSNFLNYKQLRDKEAK